MNKIKYEQLRQVIIKAVERDITLEDCLITVIKKFDDEPNCLKRGSKMTLDEKMIELVLVRWKLNTPLHQQSPETINFLHNLICK